MLIWAVVAGAHNEALSVMFAVAGLLFMRKNPFLAGLGHRARRVRQAQHRHLGPGHAVGVPPRAEEGPAAVPRHGDPDGAGVRAVAPTAFFQVLRNGGYVSVGSWANPVFRFLDLFLTAHRTPRSSPG